jgi:fatty acid synthase subunit beta
MFPGAEPLKKGDTVTTQATLKSVLIQPAGKVVEVSGVLSSSGKPVMEVTSQFLYRGAFTDYETTFQMKEETPVEIHLKTPKDVAVLCSKEWFHLDDSSIDLLGKSLTFRTRSTVRYKNAEVFSSVETEGQALLELPTKEVIQVATISYEAGESFGNPVVDYLDRHGHAVEQPVMFDNPISLTGGTALASRAPSSNEPYANVSGDYNPIHVSRVFAQYVNLPGTITHGMYSSAAVRSFVETWAAENKIHRVRAFSCSFVGMVLPNDDIETKLEHVGMINGRKIIKVEAVKAETQESVLVGEAEVEQPTSSYVFTGQGSQEQGMGMDLYESSEVAKSVWDRADIHFLNNYGFSIIDIVRNNPKELTVHFGGARGKAIRENYMAMIFETIDEQTGQVRSERIFKDINENTDFYTFRSPTGLLSATQFTQPALTLMEKASFEDMKAKGLIDSDSLFAGHSLGEYSALASLAEVMPVESLVDVVFYRGMTMQVAVPRDAAGRSNYGMVAVNPSRVSPTFDDAALRFVVENISADTKWLLEIVNYNVENQQYVAAGDLRALDTLTNVLNLLKVQKINIDKLLTSMPVDEVKKHLSEITTEVSKKSLAKPQPIELERGFAVIPLKGISVPFHSSYLRSGVKPFKNFLIKKVPKNAVKPKSLIGKYIPNLTAKPFQITKEYFEEVYELTGSDKIKAILDNWDSYESA